MGREVLVCRTDRMLLAAAVVAVDLLLFVLPLTGLLAAWIFVTRPPWFRRFIDDLYADTEARGG